MSWHWTVIIPNGQSRIWKTTRRTKEVLWCVRDFVYTPSHKICLYKLFAILDFTLDKKSWFAFQVQLVKSNDNYSYSNATLHTKTLRSNECKACQAVRKGKAKRMNGWWKFLNKWRQFLNGWMVSWRKILNSWLWCAKYFSFLRVWANSPHERDTYMYSYIFAITLVILVFANENDEWK